MARVSQAEQIALLKRQLRASQEARNALFRAYNEEIDRQKAEKARLRGLLSDSVADANEVRRQLALSQERAGAFHVTSVTLARLVGEGLAQSEDLRYSPPCSNVEQAKSGG